MSNESKTEPLVAEIVPAQQPAAVGLYGLIQKAATDSACDPAKLRELLAVRREWLADEAAAAFNRAVVQFQQECKIILKGDDAYGGKKYARMDRIWREIRPLMEKCGLAVTWESVKPVGEMCVMDGHLRHIAGHAQALHHEMPYPDKITGQNAAQRAGSGETYCKRYATCAALGIQTGIDDDGNGGSAPTLTEAHAHQLRKLCAETGTPESKVSAAYGVKEIAEIPETSFADAHRKLSAKPRVAAP